MSNCCMRRPTKFHVDSAVRFWAIANIREGDVKRPPPVKRGITNKSRLRKPTLEPNNRKDVGSRWAEAAIGVVPLRWDIVITRVLWGYPEHRWPGRPSQRGSGMLAGSWQVTPDGLRHSAARAGGLLFTRAPEGAENQIFNQNLSTSLPKPTDVGPVTSIHPTQINQWSSPGGWNRVTMIWDWGVYTSVFFLSSTKSLCNFSGRGILSF